jgi:hypothetical protein
VSVRVCKSEGNGGGRGTGGTWRVGGWDGLFRARARVRSLYLSSRAISLYLSRYFSLCLVDAFLCAVFWVHRLLQS